MHTTTNETVDQWLITHKHVMFHLLLPVVGELHSQLVFKEVDKGALVSPVSPEVLPIILANLSRRGDPWFQFGDLLVVYVMQLRDSGAENIRGAQDMGIVIVVLEVVIDDGIVDVVGLQQMLEAPGPLVRVGLDVVNLDRRETNCLQLGPGS